MDWISYASFEGVCCYFYLGYIERREHEKPNVNIIFMEMLAPKSCS